MGLSTRLCVHAGIWSAVVRGCTGNIQTKKQSVDCHRCLISVQSQALFFSPWEVAVFGLLHNFWGALVLQGCYQTVLFLHHLHTAPMGIDAQALLAHYFVPPTHLHICAALTNGLFQTKIPVLL